MGLLTLHVLTCCHWCSNEHSSSLAVLVTRCKKHSWLSTAKANSLLSILLSYNFFLSIWYSIILQRKDWSPIMPSTLFWGRLFSHLYFQAQGGQHMKFAWRPQAGFWILLQASRPFWSGFCLTVSLVQWLRIILNKNPSSTAQMQILKCSLCEQWMWTMNQNILLLISLLYHHTFKDSHYFSVIYNVLHPAKLGNYSAKSGKEG